jgi:hypothetical protein
LITFSFLENPEGAMHISLFGPQGSGHESESVDGSGGRLGSGRAVQTHRGNTFSGFSPFLLYVTFLLSLSLAGCLCPEYPVYFTAGILFVAIICPGSCQSGVNGELVGFPFL